MGVNAGPAHGLFVFRGPAGSARVVVWSLEWSSDITTRKVPDLRFLTRALTRFGSKLSPLVEGQR